MKKEAKKDKAKKVSNKKGDPKKEMSMVSEKRIKDYGKKKKK